MKKNSFNLDFDELLDLNYVFKKEFQLLNKFPEFQKRTIFSGVKLFFLIFFKSLLRGDFKYPIVKNVDFLFISGSVNNSRILSPLAKKTPNSYLVGGNKGLAIPKFWAYFYSLPYFFKIIALYRISKGYNRKIIRVFFDRFWSTYGTQKMVEKMLRKTQPKVVVVANDHLMLYRSIMRIAKKMGIKTLYVQHAGTAPHFPPLQFDFAILDGQIAYDNYFTHHSGNISKVFLAGSPRFDKIAKIRWKRKTGKCLGIAVNTLDIPEKIEAFLSNIKIDFKIILRLHPGIKGKRKKDYQELAKNKNIEISYPQKEPVDFFLTNITMLIADDSFIHFEAILSGIQSYYYSFSNLNNDGYGFLRDDFIYKLEDLENIKLHLNDKIDQNQLEYLKKTIANYEDLLEGKSTLDLYSQILEKDILKYT